MNPAGAVVAVITTCFNQADFITKTVESVAMQKTEATVYHVVVDDGSTDRSNAVLRVLAHRYKGLRVSSVTNRGMAGAFNAALMALPADVEFVVVIAGDDWLEPNFVDECLKALTPQTHMVITGMRRVVERGVRPRRGADARGVCPVETPSMRQPTLRQVWEWRSTLAWGCAMFRREALVAAGGFHPHVGGDCDWDMWIDLTARGYRIAYTNKTWFYYRNHARSASRAKTAAAWNANRAEMARHHRQRTLPGQEFR